MIRVTVIGDKKVAAGLAKSARDLSTPTPALRDGGDAVARTAGRLAAKRTGRLSRSNRVTVAGNLARISNRVPYAGFQEHGTQHMRAHPFMRPAAHMTDLEPYFERYAEQVLRRNF